MDIVDLSFLGLGKPKPVAINPQPTPTTKPPPPPTTKPPPPTTTKPPPPPPPTKPPASRAPPPRPILKGTELHSRVGKRRTRRTLSWSDKHKQPIAHYKTIENRVDIQRPTCRELLANAKVKLHNSTQSERIMRRQKGKRKLCTDEAYERFKRRRCGELLNEIYQLRIHNPNVLHIQQSLERIEHEIESLEILRNVKVA